MEPYIGETIGTVIGAIGLAIGSLNIGTYYGHKAIIIKEAINGREPLTESKEPVYKSPLDRIYDLLDFGPKLAEKRYKAGKFDKIIALHTASKIINDKTSQTPIFK